MSNALHAKLADVVDKATLKVNALDAFKDAALKKTVCEITGKSRVDGDVAELVVPGLDQAVNTVHGRYALIQLLHCKEELSTNVSKPEVVKDVDNLIAAIAAVNTKTASSDYNNEFEEKVKEL